MKLVANVPSARALSFPQTPMIKRVITFKLSGRPAYSVPGAGHPIRSVERYSNSDRRRRKQAHATIFRMPQINTFLTFNTQAEEAARFYTSIFPNSKITRIARYPDLGPQAPFKA